MRLYHFPSSPHCMKVRAVAYELGIELELTTVNIFKGESDSPDFVTMNPNRLVPVLVDGDFVLWESNAILTYVADMGSTLAPKSARECADVERWLHWQSAHLGPTVSKVAFERFVKPMTRLGPTDYAAATSAEADFFRCCRVLEATLASSTYLTQRLSVADFAVACVLSSAITVDLTVETFPRTRDWLGRMLARNSMRHTFAEAELSTIALYEADRSDPIRD